MNKSTTSTGARSVNPLYKHKNSSVLKLQEARRKAAEKAHHKEIVTHKKEVPDWKGGRRTHRHRRRSTKRKHPRSQ
jgi:hypothetical protein